MSICDAPREVNRLQLLADVSHWATQLLSSASLRLPRVP